MTAPSGVYEFRYMEQFDVSRNLTGFAWMKTMARDRNDPEAEQQYRRC